ncbi:FCD domain-containing protein [Conexibacter sp. JD483]|uniref:FCD domain-containing protein n=1 Tax=unclassified Conexibacter TaxID=2627773 RepID=UPI0027229D21|nr:MULTISPECIES: FCD domain-containing protein [unclassified Conexibacter]MDO8184339.1 FCD domain-containing protein [Conexibacter sp. CPCC 205706]MDO8197645.1 FCD domain-containing protein [Conexibacter sp. CPCC 205762]MDR9368308.1 FCD domain-containing protein [Conexibacter sp. JD483]
MLDGDQAALLERADALAHDAAADAEALDQVELAFHQALIGGTRNRALCSLTESIHAAVLTTRFWLARPEYRLQRAMPEHRAIFAAVLARDPAAARAAMAAHLATVESYITAHNGARAVGSSA